MEEVLTGRYAPRVALSNAVRLMTWNIDRGEHFTGVASLVSRNEADVYLLQEVDLHARRSAELDVANELARAGRLDYVWGLAFREFNQGKDAWQGQATLSRYSFDKPRLLHFADQSGFWKPRWWVPNTPPFQERAGGRIALVTEIATAKGTLAAYNLHLESRGDEELRARQLNQVIADANRYPNHTPVVIAGDLNTKHRSSPCIRLLRDSGFQDCLGDPRRFTTNRGGPFAKLLIDGALDWIWVRGPVRFSQPRLHTDVPHVSDHWPLSVLLEL